MPLDPRTPVLAAAGAVTHPPDASPITAVDLMAAAVDAAARDGRGVAALLDAVDLVALPNGTWTLPDPGRALAARFGWPNARTLVAEVGILQQDLLDQACTRLAGGAAEVVLVVGGEARASERRADAMPAPTPGEPGAAPPDEWWAPDHDVLSVLEIERDLAVPATQYAMLERALAATDGLDPASVRRRLGALWAGYAAVAGSYPGAWDRSSPDATAIASPGDTNRLVAPPYTRLLCSQWNVDQAAALVLTTLERARRAGVDDDRLVFPWVGAVSQAMVPLPARGTLTRCAASAATAHAAREHSGMAPAEATIREVYSCFPSAVQLQCRELGIDPAGSPLSVCGGMTFGGGPLNNFVLQAMVALVERLRAAPGEVGLSTSVSGMLTKTGLGLWSAGPPARPYRALDVTAEVQAVEEVRPVDPSLTGPLVVVGSSVVCERGVPVRTVVVAEDAAGVRTVAVDRDPDTAAAMVEDHRTGAAVSVPTAGVAHLGVDG